MAGKQILKFPQGFLWGAATAAHQVEGNNKNSDWWSWEHSLRRANGLKALGLNPSDFQSGIACDSYNRYEEDFSLAQKLGHNAHRLSIEWARIEPKAGIYDEAELSHYEKVLRAAKFYGLATFVTLHHFTNPKWFSDQGGFTRSENLIFYQNYIELVTKRLGEYVDFWLTFNEPELYATSSYSASLPKYFTLREKWKVVNNLIKAHNNAANFIRHYIRKPVSMAYHLSDWQPIGLLGFFASNIAHYFANEFFISRTIKQCDFIGVNYYFHHHIGLFGTRSRSHSGHKKTDVGFGIHPEGLQRVLLNLKKHNKPIYVTENGLADSKDEKREKFIVDHLYYLHKAIEQGADVKGYLHWSLIDNFEWGYGFKPRFGLIEIDREDLLRRKVRYSAVKYAEICRNNYLEI